MGAMMALYHRDVIGGLAQEVDVALYEGIFRMLEIPVAHLHKNNELCERTPGLSGTSSPGGTYETKDGKWLVLVCTTQKTWEYCAKAMGRTDLITNPDYATMYDRLRNNDDLDQIIRDWIKGLNWMELKETADREGVPVNAIYSMHDIFNDPHYAARENIVEMPDEILGTIKMPGIVPRFSKTPGKVHWTGPTLGKHNDEIFRGLLGMSDENIEHLKNEGII